MDEQVEMLKRKEKYLSLFIMSNKICERWQSDKREIDLYFYENIVRLKNENRVVLHGDYLVDTLTMLSSSSKSSRKSSISGGTSAASQSSKSSSSQS